MTQLAVRREVQQGPGRRPVTRRPDNRCAQIVEALAWLNLAMVLTIWGILSLASEEWWVGTVLTYLPRSPFLFPALVLAIVAAKWRVRACGPCVVAIGLVLGPIMNWHWGFSSGTAAAAGGPVLKVVTCNVQSFGPRFSDVVLELSRIDPDVLALQEAFGDHPLLQSYFGNWHRVQHDEYIVLSRYPLRLVDKHHSPSFDRVTALCVAVFTPAGEALVYNVHQTSPRRELKGLRPWSPLVGPAIGRIEHDKILREEETRATREFVNSGDQNLPTFVVGDFNMPDDSSVFQAHWGDLTNAFTTASWGYGYTSPCHTSIWPDGCPWLQVDHILANGLAEPIQCRIGTSNGSDHRLMAAWMSLPVPAVAGAWSH